MNQSPRELGGQPPVHRPRRFHVKQARSFTAEEFGNGIIKFRFPEGKGASESQGTQGKAAQTGKHKAAATA